MFCYEQGVGFETEAYECHSIWLDQWDIISFIYFQCRVGIMLDNPLASLSETT